MALETDNGTSQVSARRSTRQKTLASTSAVERSWRACVCCRGAQPGGVMHRRSAKTREPRPLDHPTLSLASHFSQLSARSLPTLLVYIGITHLPILPILFCYASCGRAQRCAGMPLDNACCPGSGRTPAYPVSDLKRLQCSPAGTTRLRVVNHSRCRRACEPCEAACRVFLLIHGFF